MPVHHATTVPVHKPRCPNSTKALNSCWVLIVMQLRSRQCRKSINIFFLPFSQPVSSLLISHHVFNSFSNIGVSVGFLREKPQGVWRAPQQSVIICSPLWPESVVRKSFVDKNVWKCLSIDFRITESLNGLSCKGPQRSSSSNLPAMGRDIFD